VNTCFLEEIDISIEKNELYIMINLEANKQSLKILNKQLRIKEKIETFDNLLLRKQV